MGKKSRELLRAMKKRRYLVLFKRLVRETRGSVKKGEWNKEKEREQGKGRDHGKGKGKGNGNDGRFGKEGQTKGARKGKRHGNNEKATRNEKEERNEDDDDDDDDDGEGLVLDTALIDHSMIARLAHPFDVLIDSIVTMSDGKCLSFAEFCALLEEVRSVKALDEGRLPNASELFATARRHYRKEEDLLVERELREMRECSFRPKINRYHSSARVTVGVGKGHKNDDNSEGKEGFLERMKAYRTQRHRRIYAMRKQRVLDEVQECTFEPKLIARYDSARVNRFYGEKKRRRRRRLNDSGRGEEMDGGERKEGCIAEDGKERKGKRESVEEGQREGKVGV